VETNFFLRILIYLYFVELRHLMLKIISASYNGLHELLYLCYSRLFYILISTRFDLRRNIPLKFFLVKLIIVAYKLSTPPQSTSTHVVNCDSFRLHDGILILTHASYNLIRSRNFYMLGFRCEESMKV